MPANKQPPGRPRYGLVRKTVLRQVLATPGLSCGELGERIGEPREYVRMALFRLVREDVVQKYVREDGTTAYRENPE